MTNSIHILKPGFYTTVQDGGRYGYAHLGVPESGAMDQQAYRLANALLNNNPEAAVLECTLVGPQIEVLCDTHFAITGAHAGTMLDGETVVDGVPVFAKAGQILSLSKLTQGSRAYIAFAGGLQTEVVLGSRSWYPPVTRHKTLSKGMNIELGHSKYKKEKGAHIRLPKDKPEKVQIVGAFCGPEYKYLSKVQKEQLQTTRITVSSLWNRMAVQSDELIINNLNSIQTSPVIPGTVQLTPSGKLLVLGRDCQTTGGYPRVLQLGQEGMNKIAQMQQGSQFLFSVT